MNVSLPPELEAFIQEQVANGRYRSASEAVRASIQLLVDKTKEHDARVEALRAELDRGLQELDAGEVVDGRAAFAELVGGSRSEG